MAGHSRPAAHLCPCLSVDNGSKNRAGARDRQRRRRERMASAGAPNTHAINRAVAEALLYLVERNGRPGVPRSQTTIEFGAVVAHASLILIVGGEKSQPFDADQVHSAMQARFRRRPRAWTVRP